MNRIILLSLFSLLLFATACERFPGHYLEFSRCIEEHTPVGDEFLVAFAELEEYLLKENFLEGTDRSDYSELLQKAALGEGELNSGEIAPHVRDFWALQEQGTMGALFTCTDQLSEKLETAQAKSIHQLREALHTMRINNSFDDPETIEALIQAIEADDFEYVLYRSVPLTILVYLMR